MAKAKDTPKKQVAKEKIQSGIKKYFRGFVSEIKNVTWPTRKELMNTTVVVLVFILVFSVVVGLIDLGLGKLLELIT